MAASQPSDHQPFPRACQALLERRALVLPIVPADTAAYPDTAAPLRNLAGKIETIVATAGGTMSWRSRSCRAFKRDLPGGGYVAIDVTSTKSMWRRRIHEGKVVAERRATWRREGHAQPVVAEASGRSLEAVVQQLFPMAQCNATIGSALLRHALV